MRALWQLLDPRRSLATAIGWLAAMLSLAVAAAGVWVNNEVRDQLNAARDVAMVSVTDVVAQEVDRALERRLHDLGTSRTGPALGAKESLIALRPDLAPIIREVRERSQLDRRLRIVLLDEDEQVLVDSRASNAPPAKSAIGAVQDPTSIMPVLSPDEVVVQRPDSGHRQLAVKAGLDGRPTLRRLGLNVMLVQPTGGSLFQGSDTRQKVAALTLGLSVIGALVGIAFARRLTRRLTRLTAGVKRVGTNPAARLEAPIGIDEVSTLGQAFSALLDSLRQERDALNHLTADLEHRVNSRTRDVERLAADNRYAAVVRERLRLARDLHDTLAHSMMAMLAEIRTLRKLYAQDPAGLAPELERAERVAHDGLKEARDAIGQMRLDPVRDLGLGPALASAVGQFADRTGVELRYRNDHHAASFADIRAETIFRIAKEALSNIERHAHASRVDISLLDGADGIVELTIEDNGIGFDPEVARPGHYGMIGIKEQVRLIGAQLSLTSEAQRGTRLQVRLHVGAEFQAETLT